MTARRRATAAGEAARFVAVVSSVTVALAVVGYVPTRRLGGPAAVTAMLLALGIVGVASTIGAVPVFLARRSGRPRAHVPLAAMLVRLVTVALLALIVGVALAPPLAPLLLWLGIGYVILLVVDTAYALRALGSL